MRLELHSDLEPFRAQLEGLAKPSARIRTTIEDAGLVGSKFGGEPYTPQDFVWPMVQIERKKSLFRKASSFERPLTFLAQINFSEVREQCPDLYALDWGLPSAGLFQVFYDVEDQPWGFMGDDAHWRFFWYESCDARLHKPSLGPSCPTTALKMLFSAFLSLPDDAGEQLDFDDEDSELLPNYEGVEPQHALGGWPAPVQGAPFYEIPPDEGKADSIEAKTKLASAWRLILQIDSDEDHLGYMWGDVGMLYIGVRETDLRANDLSKPWLELQCG